MTPTAECTLGTSPPKPCSVSDRRRSGAGSSAAPWQQRVWRTSARRGRPDWTDRLREVVEAALARVVGNRTEAACARSDLCERWRRLMDVGLSRGNPSSTLNDLRKTALACTGGGG